MRDINGGSRLVPVARLDRGGRWITELKISWVYAWLRVRSKKIQRENYAAISHFRAGFWEFVLHRHPLTRHFIWYSLLGLGWNPFCLQNWPISSIHTLQVQHTFLQYLIQIWLCGIIHFLPISWYHIHNLNLPIHFIAIIYAQLLQRGPNSAEKIFPTPLYHHYQPKPLTQGTIDLCFHVVDIQFWNNHLEVTTLIEINRIGQWFSNLLLPNFGRPVWIIASATYLSNSLRSPDPRY